MADSILRLKVESQEYDNKLKQAANGLTRYVDECRKVGGTLEVVEKETLDYVRALGQMDTTSRTATGKLAEMKKTFVELSAQYKQMTDAEKQSPFGKALSSSLDQLKVRINDSKAQLDDINNSLNGGSGLSGALDSIAGKFGMNIEQLTKFGSVLGVTTTALKVAKDAFFQNETNVDDWGRTVAATEGIYDSFLQTLNNGDFSGFIQRIGEVISKAKEAYNALDELNTRMTIINPERTRLQARATELKATIRRQGKDSAEGQAAQTELRQIEGMLTQAFKTESQMNMNVFKSEVDKKLKEAGITLNKKDYDFLMRTFSSDASYMAMKRGAKGSTGRSYDVSGGSYDEGSTTGFDTRNMNQKLLDLFTDEWRKEYSPYLNAAFGARGAAASTMLSDARYLKEGGAGGGGGKGGRNTPEYIPLEGSIDAQTKKVQDLQKAWRAAADDDSRRRIKEEIDEQQYALDMMTGKIKQRPKMEAVDVGVGIAPSSATDPFANIKDNLPAVISPLQQLEDHLKELIKLQEEFGGMSESAWQIYQKEIENTKGQIDNFKNGGNDVTKGGKDIAKSWRTAASAISTVGSAMSGLKNPAIDIMTVIGQSIATIALSYAENLAGDNTTKGNIWAFIAAAAAATVSMATTIASIHSATGYAQGGIVKGNSYSGDNVPALVDGSQMVGLNAGEVVLTAAMTNNLAAGIQNGGSRIQVVGKLSGEQLFICAERWAKRTGKGEFVTWR